MNPMEPDVSAPPTRPPGNAAPAATAAFRRYVGLDVHKRTVVACVLDAAGNQVHGETFDCTREALERFATRWLGSEAAAALEATSNTWAVCNVLSPHCGALKVGNPLKTRAIAEARVKTDTVDAAVLAQLLRCDYLPGVWIVDPATRQLRQTVGRRTALVQNRTGIKNRIHSTLASELIVTPVERLFGCEGLSWLKQVEVPERCRQFIDSDLRLLEALDLEIAELDKELARAAHVSEQARLLMTLPGVDYHVATALLAALGDISRFKDGDHAAAYLGLAPSTHQSGSHCYHGSITKQGNSHARWMLVEAAQHLDKHPGPLGVFFRRLAKKKNRNVAVTATARKLVVIALLMLKHNEPYRYAQPERTKAKLARARVLGGAGKHVGGTAKGHGRHPNYGKGVGSRGIPSLQDVYAKEGLPAPAALADLPAGERRMLQDKGLLQTTEAARSRSRRLRPEAAGKPAAAGGSPTCGNDGEGSKPSAPRKAAKHSPSLPAPRPQTEIEHANCRRQDQGGLILQI
jgi:transposase